MSDGPVGDVRALVVGGASDALSAIIVRVGDGPTSREQTIPIGEVKRIGSRTLSLRLARGQVARLPARPG